MRKAMYEAEVGNDGNKEDPTVNKLEEKSASLMGKEAALFISSGTMGNLIANMSYGKECNEVIMESGHHSLNNEFGGVSAIAHRIPRSMQGIKGKLPLEDIKRMMRAPGSDISTGLIWLENTHNNAGGVCLPLQYINDVCDLAHASNIPVHIDGARIFNAAAALKVSAKELCASADSVMFCLSKGLACPIGSMLVGSKEFISRARFNRKRLGGQTRQAGIIAAAGLVALDQMIDRLVEDNMNAHYLAEQLSVIPELGIDLDSTQTNMVFLNLSGKLMNRAKEFAALLKEEDVSVNVRDVSTVRLVTHKDVSNNDIKVVIPLIEKTVRRM